MNLFDWLFRTDAGLLCRVGIGVAIFSGLAISDIRRRGRQATRWREYLFLLVVVAMAVLYGVANNLVTCRISWEYFLYGKGLIQTLGSTTPPDTDALSCEAAKIGFKATWSAGLVIGVCFLVANNPSRKSPQLPYRRLLLCTPRVFASSTLFAVLLGFAGSFGWLAFLSTDFAEMVRNNEFRPYRFMAVYGIHLGGYVGGVLGTIWSVISIRTSRKQASRDMLARHAMET